MHVSGIPVRIDYRWFFVVLLMSAITAGSINSKVENALGSFVLGLSTTLVFFVSIFLHEFAHAIVAKMEGLKVLEIVLHPFGGLTRFSREPETPRAEFRIAIAGPAASFLLAVLFVLLMAAANSAGVDILAILLFLLALSNFLLAVFNLFPGYPLDGGRVLRAYLWRNGKDLNEATILTGRCGQVIAVGLMVFGIFIVIARQEFFTGFWAILVGLFLFDSAKGIICEVRESEMVQVGDVMQLRVAVPPDMVIQQFVDNILPLNRHTIFPVAMDKQLYGILLLEEMKKITREKWRQITIREVMRPITPDQFVETHTSLAEARELMLVNGIGALCVIDAAGNLVGFIQRSHRSYDILRNVRR